MIIIFMIAVINVIINKMTMMMMSMMMFSERGVSVNWQQCRAADPNLRALYYHPHDNLE